MSAPLWFIAAALLLNMGPRKDPGMDTFFAALGAIALGVGVVTSIRELFTWIGA